MNYNDHIQTQQQYALFDKDINQQEYHNLQSRNEPYQINDNKFKNNYLNSSKPVNLRGKQNDVYNNQNINKNSIQGTATNHSFNGLFNQNKSQMKGSKKDVNKQIQFFDTSNNKNFIKSKSFKNFGNSSRLSNYQFITDSTQKFNQNQTQIQIHPQTQKFIIKYFSDNYNSNDFYQQYISLTDFVDILFEEYQNVIGKSNNVNLIEDFTNKIYMIFGQQIFFEDLFEKTIEHGLIGLILEAFKSIQQDDAERKNVKLSNQIKPKHTIIDSRYQNNPSSKNLNNFNNSTKNALSRLTIDSSMNSQQLKNPITKISLDKYFSNQNSKVNIFDNSSQFNQQDLEDIKNLLSDYIQGMYDEAEKKLNKKYTNEFKKLSLKYKDTEKLLQKINQKISHHYDTLSTIKQYQKKVKTMKDKEIQLQNKIKFLQSQCKGFKDQCEKEKQNNTKLNQQIQKLNKKMQKYENAFFQKAMQKQNGFNNLSTSQISKNLNVSTIQTAIEKPNIEFRIDTYTQHRPFVTPISNNIRSYSPYIQRQSNIPTTPKQFKQGQRGSVSPIGKRISFNQPQNNIVPLNSINSINPMNPNLQISTVQRVQIGDPIMLRPTSPIGKLQPSMNQVLNQKNNQNYVFSTSRITSVSPMRR